MSYRYADKTIQRDIKRGDVMRQKDTNTDNKYRQRKSRQAEILEEEDVNEEKKQIVRFEDVECALDD